MKPTPARLHSCARLVALLGLVLFLLFGGGESYRPSASALDRIPTGSQQAWTNYCISLLTNGSCKLQLTEGGWWNSYGYVHQVFDNLKTVKVVVTNTVPERIVLEAKEMAVALANQTPGLIRYSLTNQFMITLTGVDNYGLLRYNIGAKFFLTNVGGVWRPNVDGDPVVSIPDAVGTGDDFVRFYLPFDNIKSATLVLQDTNGAVISSKLLPLNMFYMPVYGGAVNVKGQPNAWLPPGPSNIGPPVSELQLASNTATNPAVRGFVSFETFEGSAKIYDLSGFRTNLSEKVFDTSLSTTSVVRAADGSMVFSGTVSGAPGEILNLQCGPTAKGPWTTFSTFVVPASGETNWTHTVSPSSPGAFYQSTY